MGGDDGASRPPPRAGSPRPHRARRPGWAWLLLFLGVVAVLSGAGAIVATTPGRAAPAHLQTQAQQAETDRHDPANAPSLSDVALPPPVIEATARPQDVATVAPPSDSPIHAIRRDCPINAPLSDGRSLWIFCDSSLFGPDGKLAAFSNTTAGFAEHDDPA